MFKGLPAPARKSLDAMVKLHRAEVPLLDYVASVRPKAFLHLLPKIQSYGFGWSQAQIEAAATAHLLNSSHLLPRGYTRRILYDSVADLVRSASLAARLQLWQGTRDAENDFLYHALDRLKALGAGDLFVVQRFVETVPPRVTSGNESWRFAHSGMAAAFRRDDDLLRTAIADFETWKKPLKYVGAMYVSFRGLLAKDSKMVAAGLNDLLKVSKQIKHLDEIYKVISLETHGMYELCRYYEPALVLDFNVERELPWDKSLCAWVRQNEGKPPFYDVTTLSPELQHWLTELPFRDDRIHYWNMGDE